MKKHFTILVIHALRLFLPKAFLLIPLIVFGIGIFSLISAGVNSFIPDQSISFFTFIFEWFEGLDIEDDKIPQFLLNKFLLGVGVLGILLSIIERITKNSVKIPVWRISFLVALTSLVSYVFVFNYTGDVSKGSMVFFAIILHIIMLFKVWLYILLDKGFANIIKHLTEQESL